MDRIRRLASWLTSARGLFWVLLGSYLALRLLQAASSPHSYDDEDGFTLNSAWEMLYNNVWPYPVYQLTDWENGTRLSALVALPLTWLLGPSVLALKLTGVVFSTVTLVGLWLTVRELFGRPAANLAMLLYILAPTPVFEYSLTAHGFHPDSLAIQLLFLWRLTVALKRGASLRGLALVGLLGSFAIWYAYISAALVLCGSLMLIWAIWRGLPGHEPRRRWAQVLAYGAGLAVFGGLWLAYNLDNDFRGLFVYHDRSLGSFLVPGGAGETEGGWRHALQRFLYFSNDSRPDDLPATGFNLFYWALAVLALGWALLRGRRRGDTPAAVDSGHRRLVLSLAGAMLLLLYLLLGSSHIVNPSHLVPLLVLAMIPVAGLLTALMGRGQLRWRATAAVLVSLLVLPGLGRNLDQIHWDAMGVALHVDGRNYPNLIIRAQDVVQRTGRGQIMEWRRCWVHLPLELGHLEKIQDGFAMSNFAGTLLDSVADHPRHWKVQLDQFINGGDVPGPREKRLVLSGIMLTAPRLRVLHELQTLDPILAGVPEPDERYVLQGIGFSLMPEHWQLALHATAATGEDPRRTLERLRSLAFGMGRGTTALVLHVREDFRCGGVLPPRLRRAFFRGLGHGMACRLLRGDPEPVARWICPRWRNTFRQGFMASGDRCRQVIRLQD